MPVELESRPEGKVEKKRIKTEFEKKMETREQRKFQDKFNKYNAILAKEGMPEELPPDIWSSIEGKDRADRAASSYAHLRDNAQDLGYYEGEHERVALAIAKEYKISKEEALSLIEDAFASRGREKKYKKAA